MSTDSRKRSQSLGWMLLLILLLVGFFWIRSSEPKTSSPAPSDTRVPAPLVETTPASNQASTEPTPASPSQPRSSRVKTDAADTNVPPDPTLLARFKSFHARLRAGMTREDTLTALRDLKRQVHDLPPEVAAATLIALLQLGDDAATGLEFVVGDEGVLDESPTYRTALLDLLGQTEPDAAVTYSQTVLKSAPTPDEYALALRNLGWLNHEGDLSAELNRHFGAMLDNAEWFARPTDGYLEAFDIAAAVGGTEMITNLVSVLRLTTKDGTLVQPAVNRAAFIALDRIMLREPGTVAAIYTQDPSFMEFAPNHRASLLSRLDPGSAPQAEALRRYLQTTPSEAPELAYFGRIFPNANFFDGNRLVTSWDTPAASRTRERDANALAFVTTLLADPAYSGVAPALRSIRNRLESFAE